MECCGLLQINQIEGHHHLVGSLATVMFDVWRSNRTKITDVFGRGCEVTDEVKERANHLIANLKEGQRRSTYVSPSIHNDNAHAHKYDEWTLNLR